MRARQPIGVTDADRDGRSKWATDLILRLASVRPGDTGALKFILDNAYTEAYQDGLKARATSH